jgi:protease-4
MHFLATLFYPLTALLRFIQRYFKALLFLLFLFLLFGLPSADKMKPANLMKIELSGPIFDSESFLQQIEDAEKSNIKGVLLVVNSPGGAVAPSIEMALAVKRLKEKKPVVSYASGIMASGSYYASIYSSKIIANPGSMIGSIGVIMQSPNIKELADKLGIKEQVVKAGKYKEIGTSTREWSKVERGELQTMIDDTYDMFVTDVAKARGLNKNRKTEFADAHIFTARMAKKVGLIDEVGSIYEAEKLIEKLSSVNFPSWKKKDRMEKLMDKLAVEGVAKVYSYFYGLKAYGNL